MKYADLHLHTFFSDGTLSPDELVRRVKEAGLSAMAVTDHDTVDGIPQCLAAGEKAGIEVLPSIELTAQSSGAEVHILGYCIDHTDAALRERLVFLKKNRVERVHKIIEKLHELGVKLDAKGVFEIARGGCVGRMHVAMAMVKQGLIDSVSSAFKRYIGDRGPAYVLGFKMTPREAIELIAKSRGVAVLAHPYTIHNDELIPEFAGYGLKGLEVYYPEHTASYTNYFLELARTHHLLVTGGSDFHGSAKPDITVGIVKVPYELVEKLKEARPR